MKIDRLREMLAGFSDPHKTDIVISMLKDHSIKTEWLASKQKLARLLTSGSLPTSHLESLFNSCRHNRNFTAGLEKHITNYFCDQQNNIVKQE